RLRLIASARQSRCEYEQEKDEQFAVFETRWLRSFYWYKYNNKLLALKHRDQGTGSSKLEVSAKKPRPAEAATDLHTLAFVHKSKGCSRDASAFASDLVVKLVDFLPLSILM